MLMGNDTKENKYKKREDGTKIFETEEKENVKRVLVDTRIQNIPRRK